mmetsp:Transcript_29080/g.28055  ORF Transcript_29080/g.28055 Transcript_29080/m.28055 type:complete len:244 (+) Transcript_29080:341-1072(+)
MQTKLFRKSIEDQSYRTQLRRGVYTFYLGLKEVGEKFTEFTLLHWLKLAVFLLYLVSVSNPTLINFILFLLFLAICISKESTARFLWSITVVYTTLILMVLYTYDVFFTDNAGVNVQALYVIGVTQPVTDGHTYLWKYSSYMILVLVLVLNHYIIYSTRYEAIMIHYMGRDREMEVEEKPNEEIILADGLSKWIIRNSMFILIAALMTNLLFLPVTVFNFILQIFLAYLIHKYLVTKTAIQMF